MGQLGPLTFEREIERLRAKNAELEERLRVREGDKRPGRKAETSPPGGFLQ